MVSPPVQVTNHSTAVLQLTPASTLTSRYTHTLTFSALHKLTKKLHSFSVVWSVNEDVFSHDHGSQPSYT